MQNQIHIMFPAAETSEQSAGLAEENICPCHATFSMYQQAAHLISTSFLPSLYIAIISLPTARAGRKSMEPQQKKLCARVSAELLHLSVYLSKAVQPGRVKDRWRQQEQLRSCILQIMDLWFPGAICWHRARLCTGALGLSTPPFLLLPHRSSPRSKGNCRWSFFL